MSMQFPAGITHNLQTHKQDLRKKRQKVNTNCATNCGEQYFFAMSEKNTGFARLIVNAVTQIFGGGGVGDLK
jgi:hypothetical protein